MRLTTIFLTTALGLLVGDVADASPAKQSTSRVNRSGQKSPRATVSQPQRRMIGQRLHAVGLGRLRERFRAPKATPRLDLGRLAPIRAAFAKFGVKLPLSKATLEQLSDPRSFKSTAAVVDRVLGQIDPASLVASASGVGFKLAGASGVTGDIVVRSHNDKLAEGGKLDLGGVSRALIEIDARDAAGESFMKVQLLVETGDHALLQARVTPIGRDPGGQRVSEAATLESKPTAKLVTLPDPL